MKIVVLGYMIRCPLGGMSAAYLQYVLSFKHLGHEVLYIEDSDNFESCYIPHSGEMTSDPSYSLHYAKELFANYNLQHNWSYFDEHSGNWYGIGKQQALAFCRKSDLVINISGANPLRSWWADIPCRVLIDTDPAFTQIAHLTSDDKMRYAKSHTSFFTLAENINNTNCLVPDDGIHWTPTRQPVFLPIWKVSSADKDSCWTTVMQWDSYKQKEYKGYVYGMKSMSFKAFENLPQMFTKEKFQIAMGGSSADRSLKKKGWLIVNPIAPTKTFPTYQQYINESKGEWSVAKHGYVVSNSGWFSERSACYLASGKPVIVQGTAFSQVAECGQGILTFTNMEEAAACVERVNADYTLHCTKAREWAETYFNYKDVLTDLLKRI